MPWWVWALLFLALCGGLLLGFFLGGGFKKGVAFNQIAKINETITGQKLEVSNIALAALREANTKLETHLDRLKAAYEAELALIHRSAKNEAKNLTDNPDAFDAKLDEILGTPSEDPSVESQS